MNPLVKKEIRLVLPGWILAMFLALCQAVTRPYDTMVVFLLFFGFTLMGLASIGRENSLNTFSSMLAQPEERQRIWTTKLWVLSAAFLTVFFTWLAAFVLAWLNSVMWPDRITQSMYQFIIVCLSATAVFTGGLWTALLIRQLAGAFWLTLLVPAVLAGIVAAFLSSTDDDNLVIAGLSTLIAIYSVGGFFFARWLFFRAQDVGWSGGNLVLPEWKIFSATAENSMAHRRRRPFIALLKKELQLHQFSFWAAGGLLIAHIGVLAWRNTHQFPRNSTAEELCAIFWMLWLALPLVIGAMTVAEERKLGVMESLLCLPVTRRRQYGLKIVLALLLGTLLGGVVPMFLEGVAIDLSHNNPFKALSMLPQVVVGLAFWLSLISLFASSFAKNFLQALGYSIATFIAFALVVPLFTQNQGIFYDTIAHQTLLPFLVAVPTIVFTLLWLGWLNFKNFREGWLLWRRILLGLFMALVFIIAASSATYNRFWDAFKPVEPAHGPARLSLANPPTIEYRDYSGDLLVKLPDGRTWFDEVGTPAGSHIWLGQHLWNEVRYNINPYPVSLGPRQYIIGSGSKLGSNWVSAVIRHINTWTENNTHIKGYLETVGVKPDGTLWTLCESGSQTGNSGAPVQLGDATDWKAVSWPFWEPTILLLKKDGTLWSWGTNRLILTNAADAWPRLRDFTPQQVGTDTDWQAMSANRQYLQKKDGTIWAIDLYNKDRHLVVYRQTNWDGVNLDKIAENYNNNHDAFVRKDGTLWITRSRWDNQSRYSTNQTVRVGGETDWVAAAALGWDGFIGLKSDGTLWRWYEQEFMFDGEVRNTSPEPLGIHNDWVALGRVQNGVVAIAADGSVWLWPPMERFSYSQDLLVKPPKQPPYLGNVLEGAN